MTPWVLVLIALNGLVFLVTLSEPVAMNPDLAYQFALVPYLLPARPWTAITYMFLHAGGMHILMNMIGLIFFGPPVENQLGSTKFIVLYFVSGIGGALLSLLTPYAPIVGASGAVYGVMLAFAWFWPRQQIMIWGIVPVEARVLIVLFTIVSLFGARTGQGNVAHFAHLGGFVGAFLYLRWVAGKPARAKAAWQKKMSVAPAAGGASAIDRWKKVNKDALHPVNREEYERVMTKLDAQGSGALTPGEREFLDRFSQATG